MWSPAGGITIGLGIGSKKRIRSEVFGESGGSIGSAPDVRAARCAHCVLRDLSETLPFAILARRRFNYPLFSESRAKALLNNSNSAD